MNTRGKDSTPSTELSTDAQGEHFVLVGMSAKRSANTELASMESIPDNSTVSRHEPEPEPTDLTFQKQPVTAIELGLQPQSSNVIAKRSWRAPVVMFTSLSSGLFVALGQHCLNNWLSGKLLDTSGTLDQRWASNFNTALAFLVKTLFVICVGTSFVQRQFLNISTKQQPIRVKEFDALSSGLTEFYSIFQSRIWLKNPILLLIVLVSWSIPLSSIIAPGSLTVKSLPLTENMVHDIGHQLSFDRSVYAEIDGTMNVGHDGTRATFGMRESQDLSKIALATSATSKILTTTPEFSNETYTWSFLGPALKCRLGNDAILEGSPLISPRGYAVWVGNTYPWDDLSKFRNTYKFASLDTDDVRGLNETEGNVIQIAVWKTITRSVTDNNIIGRVTECRLWNASYDVEFSYQNFEQTIIVHQVVYHNPVWMSLSDALDFYSSWDRPRISTIISYKAVMSAFGSLIVGTNLQYINLAIQQDVLVPMDMSRKSVLDITEAADPGKAAEQLFQNITLSLFSNPIFVSDSTIPVSVTVTTWQPTYNYIARELLIPYGVAFLASLICSVIGMHSFLMNKNSYQNSFSTFVRAAEGSNLNMRALIPPGDTGADPLFRNLEQKVMIMGRRRDYSAV